MGKESDLIKAVKGNDFEKVEKLFIPRKSSLPTLYRRRKKSEEQAPSSQYLEKVKQFVEVAHLNVNCQEADTGYSPLMLAVQNGNRDIMVSLIHHHADINAQDYKQNTALHLAAFIGRSDLMELLESYGAQVNIVNSDGNTPLHIACQTCAEGKLFIILKLLKAGADPFIKNFTRLTALDISAMYGRKGAVSTLLDHDQSLRKNTNAIVQAAMRGSDGIVELLLDYGVDPNSLDGNMMSRPLHEAVRFERVGAVRKLLSYGADPSLKNDKNETAESLALDCKDQKRSDEISALFQEYKDKPRNKPRFVKHPETNKNKVAPERRLSKYPLLRNNLAWTKNTPEYCNSCTGTNSNLNMLDDDPTSFWVIPALHTAWCVLDLLVDHIVTGIRVFGWDNPRMIKTFQLQWAREKSGPWQTVATFTCKCEGSSDPLKAGEGQDFCGFCRCSRYWRIMILDNYGGDCMSFQGVQFYGVELRLVKFFEKIKLDDYVDTFAQRGWNRFEDLMSLTEKELESAVANPVHLEEIKIALKDLRLTVYPLTQLLWVTTPVIEVVEGDVLPDITVQADPLVNEEIQLLIHGAPCIEGERKLCLVSGGVTDPSLVTFSNICIKPEGVYTVEVRSVRFPDVSVQSPHQLTVLPRPKTSTEVEAAFSEMEDMLQHVITEL